MLRPCNAAPGESPITKLALGLPSDPGFGSRLAVNTHGTMVLTGDLKVTVPGENTELWETYLSHVTFLQGPCIPTDSTSGAPSSVPSTIPSKNPSRSPSKIPSKVPSRSPSCSPSQTPSPSPSHIPLHHRFPQEAPQRFLQRCRLGLLPVHPASLLPRLQARSLHELQASLLPRLKARSLPLSMMCTKIATSTLSIQCACMYLLCIYLMRAIELHSHTQNDALSLRA